MKNNDPIEMLEGFYKGVPKADERDLLSGIYRRRTRRTQRVLGAAFGFSLGAVAAGTLLLWAARPAPPSASGAAALARSQMINSGLVRGNARVLEEIR